MEKYCKAPSLPLTEDPLNWWPVHDVTFPLLFWLAKRYLCIPDTSGWVRVRVALLHCRTCGHCKKKPSQTRACGSASVTTGKLAYYQMLSSYSRLWCMAHMYSPFRKCPGCHCYFSLCYSMLLQNGLALKYSYDRLRLGLCYLFLFTENSGSTVVLKIADCHTKVTELLCDTNTYETLRLPLATKRL